MSGHTPGPWAYDACVTIFDRDDLPCVVDEHRLVVAQCWDDGHSEEECEANARLIAAAPELVEALQYYLSGCTNEECVYCIRARAALAKAGVS